MGLILIMAGDLGDKEYAEVFSQMYLSVCFSFRPPRSLSLPAESVRVKQYPPLRKIVRNHLTQLYTHNYTHTRRVASEGAKGAKNVIMMCFFSIFERSWQLVEVPNGWRKANITPVFGKGRQEDPGNIKPLSLNLVSRKVTDKIFSKAISQQTQDTKVTGSSQPR